ncbi:hypothetical protein BH11PSE12_BH11PSE12_14890 [soil metagenome]
MKHQDNSNMPSLVGHPSHMPLATYYSPAVNCSDRLHQDTYRRLQKEIQSVLYGCSANLDDDDVIDFLDEIEPQSYVKMRAHWKILIADDDSSVHDTTLLALLGVKIHDRPLEFLHAYSAKEAHQVLLENPDTALILLDVVMETIDAGLKLVGIIRNELGRSDLRIILRTGQPGYAPEQRVSNEFAIDGYTTKAQLTRSILISVLNDTLKNAPPAGLTN